MKKLRLLCLLLSALSVCLLLCGCSSEIVLPRDPDDSYVPSGQKKPIGASSSYEISYTSGGDGTCCVSGISLKSGKTPSALLEIPERSPQGDLVTAVECKLVGGGFNTAITRIKLPDSVSEINEGFCSNFPNLEQVDLPDSLTAIPEKLFCGLKNLKSVSIPESVTSIGGNAFTDCDSLVTLTIPDSVQHIGTRAFSNCDSLKRIVIPHGISKMGTDAFLGLNYCAVLYEGTRTEWYSVRPSTTSVDYVTHYYSESKPANAGKFWHYVDGVATMW